MSMVTTSQTIGPFPHEAWRWAFSANAVEGSNTAVHVSGRVLDGDGQPVTDAILEAWVPHAPAGATDGLPGLQRVASDDQGAFHFAWPAKPAAGEPIAYLTVFARGLLKHQFTAVFLADGPGLQASPLLAQLPGARRASLLAERVGDGSYRWDLRLQGAQETVFFDYA